MGGVWPTLNFPKHTRTDSIENNSLATFSFIRDCMAELESRGLNEQGLYRVNGSVSKVKTLLYQGLQHRRRCSYLPFDLSNTIQWETTTIASAVKKCFRDLKEPLMTFQLYPDFMDAAKLESADDRLAEIRAVLGKLPMESRQMLSVLVAHLAKVAANSKANYMHAKNLGVVFGPTLLRPREEDNAANATDIHFCNMVVECLVESNFFALPEEVSHVVMDDGGRGRSGQVEILAGLPEGRPACPELDREEESGTAATAAPDILNYKAWQRWVDCFRRWWPLWVLLGTLSLGGFIYLIYWAIVAENPTIQIS